ncbi:MAG: hypothetical protein NZT92_09195 [Abditibacteriales bacterium]|nr:hypothetical protein [Abditibacteriales bacterium]MDW8364558.1 DUF6569 family protein [Abditibacteriales bacterium]
MSEPNDELSKLLESLQVGEPITVGRMTVFPLLMAIGGRIVGLDCFDRPATWERLRRKILAGCAIDALDPATPSSQQIQPEQAQNFIRQLSSTPLERTALVGLGEHLLFRSEGVEGFALCYEGRLLHLFAYTS